MNVVKYKRGMKLDETTTYIGRRFAFFQESKWHNPFHIGKDGTRDEVIEKYRKYILTRDDLMFALPELIDKTLICFCVPLNCHGHVLLELIEKWKNGKCICNDNRNQIKSVQHKDWCPKYEE